MRDTDIIDQLRDLNNDTARAGAREIERLRGVIDVYAQVMKHAFDEIGSLKCSTPASTSCSSGSTE